MLKKKAFYEQSLGVKLTPVSFAESNVGFDATRGAGLLEEVIVLGARRSKADSYSKKRDYAPNRERSFDELNYRAVITVAFRIK